jgi:ABC-type glycerol-3-phosphate transport system substrate-binding protein
MQMKKYLIFVLMIVSMIVGCGKKEAPTEKPLIFWHPMSGEKASALREIVDAYNATNPPIKIQEEYTGDYDSLYRKTLSALLAKRPPDLAIAYESMVAEYMKYNSAVVDLDPYLKQESKESIDDFYPMFLQSNRYDNFGNKMLSMPFTKSILMLYCNMDMLKEVGKTSPPATWSELIEDLKLIKAKRNIEPLALVRDASTFDGLVYSFGGEVYDPKNGQSLFDQPATQEALSLLHDLFSQKLAHEAAFNTYDDRNDFVSEQAAFFIRSSTSRPYVFELAKGKFNWTMTAIPHSDKVKDSRTVLFGPNLCIFKSTPEREKAAWAFIEYFTSPKVAAQWTTKSGYLPVRKSAMKEPVLQTFLKIHPANQQTADAIPFALPEPNTQGWQEVRPLLEKAMGDVMADRASPAQAAQDLQKESLRILKAK